MITDFILEQARIYLVASLKGQENDRETIHPWRRNWKFTVLHSFQVENYVLKILAREGHPLSENDTRLLRLAAILHDITKLEKGNNHAKTGANLARKWLEKNFADQVAQEELDYLEEIMKNHSDKNGHEPDFAKAVLKDADMLDEIGAMSIFMTENWLKKQSPFFFHNIRRRLINFEIPYCEQTRAKLNTPGAKQLLDEKKAFIENFIQQLADELNVDSDPERYLNDFSEEVN
jgi:putative nucleotidyltransferase with HDIG domain